MRTISVAIVFVSLVLVLSGCTSMYQKRGVEKPLAWSKAGTLAEFEGLAVGADSLDREKLDRRLDAESRSIERYVREDKNPAFSLGIIEINDDASFNPTQYEQVFAELDCELVLAKAPGPASDCDNARGLDMGTAPHSSGTLVFVFVHGWHHGCDVCDRDITCFRFMLNELSKAERAAKTGRRVMGIYVGWRGRAIWGRGDVLSIWSRKDTAQRLGRIAGKQLLDNLHERWADPDGYPGMNLITAGHSLGGAFLLSAARGRLTGNIRDLMGGEQHTYRTVRAEGNRAEASNAKTKALRARFGDLLLLLNPAIEADDWLAFDRDLKDRRFEREKDPDGARVVTPAIVEAMKEKELPIDKLDPYSSEQLPVAIALASTADSAVGTIFPISRWMAGLAFYKHPKMYRSSAQRTAVGHYGEHVTHTLERADAAERDAPKVREEAGDPHYYVEQCQCPAAWMKAYPTTAKSTDADDSPALASIESTPADPRMLFAESVDKPRKWGALKLTPDRSCERGDNCRSWDGNSPYFVIEADHRAIAGHSDVFNPTIIGFLSEYVSAYRQYREKPTPENEQYRK